MKYIASKNNVVIFTGGLSHLEVANALKYARTDFGETVNAGFVTGLSSGNVENIKTVGESISLGIKSNPEDAKRIIREIRGY